MGGRRVRSGAKPEETSAELGSILEFSGRTLVFDPHQKHLTMPWTGDERIVLIGFVVKGHDAMPPIVVSELKSSGFLLPDHDTALAVQGGVQPPLTPRVLVPHEPVLSKAATLTTSPSGSISLTPSGLDLPKPVSAAEATAASTVDSSPLVIELCAGSAVLSSVLKSMGLKVLPIDF